MLAKSGPSTPSSSPFLSLKFMKLADIQEDSSYSGSQVNTDLPRQQVINSPEWETLKNFFTHFYGEFEFRRTWQNLCEYYEESDGTISKFSFLCP